MLDPDLEFLSEAEDLLEAARADLAEWCEGFDRSAADPASIDRLFRRLHSLKGLTATVELPTAASLAHQVEEVLDQLRTGRRQFSLHLAELLSESITLLDGLVHRRYGVESRCREMTLLLKGEDGVNSPPCRTNFPPSANLDSDLYKALTAAEAHRLHNCLEQGRDVFLISCRLPIPQVQTTLPEIEQLMRSHGELFATIPGVAEGGGRIDFNLLFSGRMPEDIIDHLPVEYRMRVRLISLNKSAAPAVETAHSGALPTKSAHVVRVESERLDALLDISKNLLLQQGQLKKHYQQYLQNNAVHSSEFLERSFQDMERGLIRLQRSLNDARMVQVGFLFQRMKRVLRAAERKSGKQARLVMHGNEVALDRLVLEQLHEPLMHLVRNAVDHGIEPAGKRMTCGKPAEGSVILDAQHQGGQVTIEVRDDGGGIDLAKVRSSACAIGIIREGDALSDQQLFDLLFAPGFTTRDAVSEVSGRGVGMDVVRSQLDAIGGLVTIDSRQGEGTVVTLILPVQKTIMPVLVVSVAGHSYALDLQMVRYVKPCDPEDGKAADFETRSEDTSLPLFDLRTYLQSADASETSSPFQVVVGLGNEQAALIVDGLEGRREAVIRPFDALLRQIPGFSGVAELVDGGQALMLDPGCLIRKAAQAARTRSEPLFERSRENSPRLPHGSVRHCDKHPQGGMVRLRKATEGRSPFLSFYAGGHEYALDIMDVVEIIEGEGWISIPHAPSNVGGALLWRDQVVPIFNLALPAGMPQPPGVFYGTVLVCSCETLRVGISIERIGRMFNVAEDSIGEGCSGRLPGTVPFVNGAVCREGREVGLLDLVALLDFSKEWNCVREKNPYC